MFNSNYTYTLLPIIDSNICSQYPQYNYGKSKTLLLQTNEENTARVLINFDNIYFPSQTLDTNKGEKAILTIYNRYQDSFVKAPKIDIQVCSVPCEWTQGYGSVSGQNGNVSWKYPIDIAPEWNGNKSSSILSTFSINNQAIDQLKQQKYDINIDITNIINNVITSQSQFYGVMLKFTDSIQSGSNSIALSYYSRQTYTIYKPKITFYKNSFRQFIPSTPQETQLYTTKLYNGDLANLNISLRNFKKLYNKHDIIKFNLMILQKYKLKTFNQKLIQMQNRIIQKMYYSLIDNNTDEVLIDFCDATQVSYNLDGNYFMFNMRAIQQTNRYYRFAFRVELEDGQSLLIDNKQQTFKVQ